MASQRIYIVSSFRSSPAHNTGRWYDRGRRSGKTEKSRVDHVSRTDERFQRGPTALPITHYGAFLGFPHNYRRQARHCCHTSGLFSYSLMYLRVYGGYVIESIGPLCIGMSAVRARLYVIIARPFSSTVANDRGRFEWMGRTGCPHEAI